MKHCFTLGMSAEAKVEYFAKFIRHLSGYFYTRSPMSSLPVPETLPLTQNLRKLSPLQIPGIVALLQIMDTLAELVDLRQVEMEEIEMYRNLCVVSTEQTLANLVPSQGDGFSRKIFQFAFAAFREKAFQSSRSVSFNGWLHQIWNGRIGQEQGPDEMAGTR